LPSRIVRSVGGDDVPGVDGLATVPAVAVVAEAGWDRANDVSALISSGGSSLPRFVARRRMPAAARADRKNLGGTLS